MTMGSTSASTVLMKSDSAAMADAATGLKPNGLMMAFYSCLGCTQWMSDTPNSRNYLALSTAAGETMRDDRMRFHRRVDCYGGAARP